MKNIENYNDIKNMTKQNFVDFFDGKLNVSSVALLTYILEMFGKHISNFSDLQYIKPYLFDTSASPVTREGALYALKYVFDNTDNINLYKECLHLIRMFDPGTSKGLTAIKNEILEEYDTL